MNEACPECGKEYVITFPQLTLIVPQYKWYRSGTRIAIVLDIHHYLVHRQIQALGDCFDDAHIGLMGYYPLDVRLV